MNIIISFRYFIFTKTNLKGKCSTRWKGFDGCPVAVAYEPENYCRTKTMNVGL